MNARAVILNLEESLGVVGRDLLDEVAVEVVVLDQHHLRLQLGHETGQVLRLEVWRGLIVALARYTNLVTKGIMCERNALDRVVRPILAHLVSLGVPVLLTVKPKLFLLGLDAPTPIFELPPKFNAIAH